jgi:hypothetical protein
MLTPGDCEKFMSSDGYRELLSLGIILAAVVFFSNHVLSYAQELPAKTDSISDITSEIAIPTATSSVQQQTPQEQFITPGLSSLSDRDNSIRNLPLEPKTQEKATDLTMIPPEIIQQNKKGILTEQQIDNQELSKDIVSDKKQQLDKIMKDSLTESKSTFQPEDSEEKQQDKYSDEGNTDNTDNTDSEDQEEIQHDERVNEEEENNNRQNNNDKDDNNNDNIPLELPIPFP